MDIVTNFDPSFRFDEPTHAYYRGGTRLPGVTTLLADEGFWFNPNANSVNRDLGTAVHRGCKIAAEGRWRKDTTHPDVVPRLENFLAWQDENKFEPIWWEQSVYSDFGYAGTVDLFGFAHKQNQYWLPDMKSGAPPQYAAFQTALYEQAARERGLIPSSIHTVHRCCLQLHPRYRMHSGGPNDLKIALAAVTCWHARRALGVSHVQKRTGAA